MPDYSTHDSSYHNKRCIDHDPSARPPAREVVEQLTQLNRAKAGPARPGQAPPASPQQRPAEQVLRAFSMADDPTKEAAMISPFAGLQ